MSVFASAEQFYACTQALFARIGEENPHAADKIMRERLVIRIHCTGPEVEFTIDGRERPPETTFGPTAERPTLDIGLSADTLHHIMRGELALKSALAQGRLQVRGPVWKVLALADLFRQMQSLYPQVLRECGPDSP